MRFNKFLQISSDLFAENRLLKFVVVVLAVGFVWCAYKVNDIKDKVRTVVVPPHINSKIEISGSWTTESYIREYMRYMGALLWNYSPSTARNQFNELLPSWHPEAFVQAKERLYILASQIEQTGASSAFYINQIAHNAENNYVEVTGNRNLMLQNKTVEAATKTYFVAYKVENGRFWIVGVEEKTDKNTRPVGLIPALANTPGKVNGGAADVKQQP